MFNLIPVSPPAPVKSVQLNPFQPLLIVWNGEKSLSANRDSAGVIRQTASHFRRLPPSSLLPSLRKQPFGTIFLIGIKHALRARTGGVLAPRGALQECSSRIKQAFNSNQYKMSCYRQDIYLVGKDTASYPHVFAVRFITARKTTKTGINKYTAV
jgi:hypothetical protein